MPMPKQWRRRLRALLRRADVERELDEELAFHIALETEQNVRAGLDPGEARRRARLAFGGVERHKEAVRDARWMAWAPGLSLDFKLGFRMLLKYPGLTLVGGLAMAFAIALGTATFEFLGSFVYPSLPLPGGDRIVAVRNWDAAASRPDARALHDLATWRAEARTIEDIGAYRDLERNLVTGDGRGEPADVAEISASAFRVTRVPPLLGRPLVEADERPGAPAVAVIGHALWRARFGGDTAVVGRTVRLGGDAATIVGVMPEAYAFPFAHDVWMPLRDDRPAAAPGEGPPVRVFGRLAPGASLAAANAELATIAQRAAVDHPATHANLRAQVLPYARSHFDASGWELAGIMSGNLLLVLVLVLVCGNVALLLFARAATREGEIVVRTALGASRGRIVMQLLAEALVLGGIAAVVGLATAALALRWMMDVLPMIEEELPFWFRGTLSPVTVLYAVGLTLLGAVVAGVMPALKVTRGLGARLKQASAGGGGVSLGGVWTVIIVLQVAVTVAVPMHAFQMRRESSQLASLDVGVPALRYLAARVEMDRDAADTAAAFARRYSAAHAELARRLLADPDVEATTYADRLPGMLHPAQRIEVEGLAPRAPDSAATACNASGVVCGGSAAVAPDYFEVLGATIVAGRGFHAGDLAPGARTAVVNRSFADRVLGGAAVGRRVRLLPWRDGPAEAEPGPWLEIVGVVGDLGMRTAGYASESGAGIYRPASPADAYPASVAVRLRGAPAAFAPRLRTVATDVDPTLRLHHVVALDEIYDGVLRWLGFLFWVSVVGVSLAVLLSLAGIYAVMSFTVARRTREIGIRVALGADRRALVLAIFRRPLAQVALGVVTGAVLAGLVLYMESGRVLTARGGVLFVGYAALMFGICLLACVVPTRRALGVEPTEALRADG